MKYFTPERLRRVRVDLLDEDQWDQCLDAYTDDTKQFRRYLPDGAKHLLDAEPLHDATVVMAWHPQGAMVLQLATDTPPNHRLYTLEYTLHSPLQVMRHSVLSEWQCDRTIWLYDEFSGPAPKFTHSVLFEGGLELTIPFVDLKVRSESVPRPLSVDEFLGKLTD